MAISGIFTAIFVGLLIGALGRILVPKSQPVGCLLTMIIGIVAALAGAAVGNSQGWGFWAVFAVQLLIAAIIVAIFTAALRPRR